jgi:hypothetical protein
VVHPLCMINTQRTPKMFSMKGKLRRVCMCVCVFACVCVCVRLRASAAGTHRKDIGFHTEWHPDRPSMSGCLRCVYTPATPPQFSLNAASGGGKLNSPPHSSRVALNPEVII